jgi:hypothetical protein
MRNRRPARGRIVTARIFVKLIFGVLCLLIVALSAVDVLASRVAESNYREHLSRELEQKARMLTLLYHAGDSEAAREALEQLSAVDGSRITAIAPDGRVLADTEGDPDRMENHRQRPEVMEALNGRVGQSIRRSPTVGEEFLYVAVPSPQGAMRVAVPMSAMAEQVNSIRKRLLFSTALAFVPAILIAGFFARYVSSRLGAYHRICRQAGARAISGPGWKRPGTTNSEFSVAASSTRPARSWRQRSRTAARAPGTGEAGAGPERFRDQCLARVPNAAGVDSGLHGDAAGRRDRRSRVQCPVFRYHPPKCRAAWPTRRRPADARESN